MALLRLGASERLCRLDCWDSPSCALFVWKTRDLSDATRGFPPFYLLRERLRRGLHVSLERGSCVLRSLRCSWFGGGIHSQWFLPDCL